MTTWRLIVGDAETALRDLPDESVHCVVTSPPYWRQRDYATDGQIGLEPTIREWLDRLVATFAQVRRVLRKDGTMWLNVGDAYASSPPGRGTNYQKNGLHNGSEACAARMRASAGQRRSTRRQGMPPKSLLGLPWRLAFALQDDGWILRSDIVWHKPNAMPESVRDRPSTAHEYLLVRSQRYYYDLDAGRQPHSAARLTTKRHNVRTGRDDPLEYVRAKNYQRKHADFRPAPTGAPCRTVWAIHNQPHRGEHYAAFPERLVDRCLRLGTSRAGCCVTCGAQLVRVVETDGADLEWQRACGGDADGWRTTCRCATVGGDPTTPLVLDPFAGTGTTGVVALGLGCSFVGVELCTGYAAAARRRIIEAAPLLRSQQEHRPNKEVTP